MRELVDKQLMLEDAKSWVAMDSYEQHLINNMLAWIENLPTVEVSDEDCIIRREAIEVLKEAFNPSIMKFVQSKLAIENLPSVQPYLIEINKEEILKAGMEGREVEFRIGGRLFAIREKAQ